MTAHPPGALTERDLARIAQFNRTETTFPDQFTLQELIEARVDQHSLETAVICDHDNVFGVPLFFFEREPFWGHDRLPVLEDRLTEAGLKISP